MELIGDSGRRYKAEPNEIRIGISSLQEPRMHIPIIDYDSLPIDLIEKNLQAIRRKHHLPAVYIFKTSNGRHSAVCFRKVSWHTYKKILFMADCCPNFRFYTIRCKRGTMRIDPKPNKPSMIVLLKIIKPYPRSHVAKKEDILLKKNIFKLIERCGGRVW